MLSKLLSFEVMGYLPVLTEPALLLGVAFAVVPRTLPPLLAAGALTDGACRVVPELIPLELLGELGALLVMPGRSVTLPRGSAERTLGIVVLRGVAGALTPGVVVGA